MKRTTTRLFSITLIFSLLLSTMIAVPSQAETLWSESKILDYFNGAKIESIKRLSTSGWQNINVITADLSKSVKLDVLVPSQIGKSSKVIDFVKGNNAIAATNGGFFSSTTAATDAIGPIVKDGKLISYNGDFNPTSDSMVSLYEDKDGLTKSAYFHPFLYVKGSDNHQTEIKRLNSSFVSGAGLGVYNTSFMSKTFGSQKYPEIVELIVNNGIMSELRENMPSTTIPQTGFVVIGTGNDAQTLKNIYRNGDALEFDALTYPPKFIPLPTASPSSAPSADPSIDPLFKPYDLEVAEASSTPTPTSIPNSTPAPSSQPLFKDMRYCMNGGSYLVNNGAALTKFSHIPSTTSVNTVGPKTGVGISKDCKKIFIVTVDGGGEKSVGMSLQGFANYMKELGAWTAINFDGGGSTSMASKVPGTTSFQLNNLPTDGGGRSVVNAFAVVSSKSKDSIPVGIEIVSPDSIFSGSSKGLTLAAWDRTVNTCQVDASKIKWSVDNACGEIIKGVFYGRSQGVCKVTAEYLGKTTSAQISVLGKPVRLVFSSSLLKVSPNSESTISVSAISSDGFSKKLSPSTVKISVNGDIGQMIAPDLFLSGLRGAGFLTAEWNGLTASLPISVYSVVKKQLDSFDKNKYIVSKTDGDATASLKVTDSLSLTYKFPKTESPMRTISIKYKTPLLLPIKTYKITFETNSDKANSNSVVVILKDKNGEEFLLLADPGFDKAGNVTMSVMLPKLAAPASVTQIDFFEGECVGDNGVIAFDNMKALYYDYPVTTGLKIPPASTYPDPAKLAFTAPAAASTQVEFISMYGLQQGVTAEGVTKKGFITSATKAKKKYFIGGGKAFKKEDNNYLRILNIDTHLGGIVKTDQKQYALLIEQLAGAGKRDIIITMNLAPENWKNSLEKELFYSILEKHALSSKKIVTLICPDHSSSSTIINGVRKINIQPLGSIYLSKNLTAQYLEFRTSSNSLQYSFKVI